MATTKTTYRVTCPDGTERTRVSTRTYAFARILDLSAFRAADDTSSPYLVTFHGTKKAADRRDSDRPMVTTWTVVPVEICG
jgi:hypothetical protein